MNVLFLMDKFRPQKNAGSLALAGVFFDLQVGLVAALHLAQVGSSNYRSFVPGAKCACNHLNHVTAGFTGVLAPDSTTVVEDGRRQLVNGCDRLNGHNAFLL
jgi:hypothetical protein